ncbi:hypothetical protein [Candidatus Albibeggiatoa sp. nov. BB20]|uniref:hypothetical protein n=1 Tax=Candidatus Albibeggiatoa sp. nov. BB20 TaxID=3162723 RepID=UPI0033658D0A
MSESENQENSEQNQSSEPPTQKAKITDPQNLLQTVKKLNFSPTVIVISLLGLLLIAWMITKTIENMRSTVKPQSNTANHQSNSPPRVTTSGLDVNQLSMGGAVGSNNLSPLRDSDNPNTETAFVGNSETNPTHTLNRGGSRVETAFENQPRKTMDDIKAAHKNNRPIPEQLQLDMQVHYQDSQWAILSQDLLQLEESWKNNLQFVSQRFSTGTASNNNFSIQAVKQPIKTQIIETRDILWSDVLDDILEMESIRTAMTDIFAQHLHPQAQPTALSQLSDKFSPFETVSSWQQLTEQILAVEDYRADMLQTAQQVLCCEK